MSMDLIRELGRVRDAFLAAKDEIFLRHPTWDKMKDARVSIFSKCINVCNSTYLGMTYIQFHLIQERYWKTISVRHLPREDIQIYIKEFDMFIKMGLLQFIYSSIESGFRLFVKTIDPKACAGGTSEFKNIYSFFLTRLGLSKFEHLLDLLRLIRNTVHNNGVYFHRSNIDETVTYQRKKYFFRIGKPVDFVNWRFLLSLMPDVRNLLIAVVESRQISRAVKILDPFF